MVQGLFKTAILVIQKIWFNVTFSGKLEARNAFSSKEHHSQARIIKP